MRASRYASLWYYPQPQTEVACPPGDRPGRGCQQEREDAIAAYTHALMWTVTREEKYAKKALEIMDLWSATLKNHTGANSGLQSAWAGSTWVRAAEIMRYVYKGWAEEGVTRFDRLLREMYLPQVAGGSLGRNGNWDLVMADAAASIGVFLDDRPVFERAVARVRNRVPAYFYVRGDGPRPKAPPGAMLDTPADLTRYWFGQRKPVDGLAQETCRNFEHVGYALAATAHVAETAHHQGIDLWREIGPRLRPALELHADYQLRDAETAPYGRGQLIRGPLRDHLAQRLPQEPAALPVGAQQGGERQALLHAPASGAHGVVEVQGQSLGDSCDVGQGLAEVAVDPVAQLGMGEQGGVRTVLAERLGGEPRGHRGEPRLQDVRDLLDEARHLPGHRTRCAR